MRNISKQKLLLLAVAVILFLIPFFWFKPGEMDLGGDSSRLYFYNPISYVSSAGLYLVSPSSYGDEYLGIVGLPFFCFLIILKSIISSPTNIISISYGINLSLGFLFCSLIIRELIGDKKNSLYASIIGGLLYVFSPALIDAWTHVIITYNQIFLNPLIFYLLLKYFKSQNIRYIFVVLLLTLIFSPNFSSAAAPSIFSFYPLSIFFLTLYTKLILKKSIAIKHLVFGFFLFLGLQTFQLIPQLGEIFSKGSSINSTIFSQQGKFDRGLSYFSAIAPSIKASINLFVLPQMKTLDLFSNVFFALPFIIIVSLFFTKNKTILLSTFFFLIAFFFVTANVTDLGLSTYKSLFSVPGFSMFRNFNGQWIYTYMFFYSILFGQSLCVLLDNLKKFSASMLIFFLAFILIIDALPLIKGDVTKGILGQSNNVKAFIKMDPDYEKALSFIHSLPEDARILTLPLSDPSYQVIAGENGGAYMGPSTIAYLAGKKDFTGYDEFQDYKGLLVKSIQDDQLETFKQILGFLNIRYIFYNSDSNAFDKFPDFPFQTVHLFLPKNQNSYKKLVKKLNLKEIKNINNKFFVYELPGNYFIPQIFTTKNLIKFNNLDTEILTPISLNKSNNKLAIFNSLSMLNSNIYSVIPNLQVKFNQTIVDVTYKNSITSFISSTTRSILGLPFSSWSMDSLAYPLLMFREKKELVGYSGVDQASIDKKIFFAEKRIIELTRWAYKTKIMGNVKSIDQLNKSWQEPSIIDAMLHQKYNYWEISMVRYQRALYDIIDNLENASKSNSSIIVNKDRVRKTLELSKEELYGTIQESKALPNYKKIYLGILARDMFDAIEKRLAFKMPEVNKVAYNLDELEKGDYDLYLYKNSLQSYSQVPPQVVINNKNISEFEQDNEWFKVSNVSINDNNQNTLSLIFPQQTNHVSNTNWEPVEKMQNDQVDSIGLTTNNFTLEDNGLIRKIDDWTEKSYYIVSFDYLTHNNTFKISLFEKIGKNNDIQQIDSNEELRSGNWKKYQTIVSSSDNANSAFIQIFKQKANSFFNTPEVKMQNAQIDIKNLSVIQIPFPKVIFKKINAIDKELKPDVVFTRINPTKYKVDIHNATSPYTLVLADKFNEKWELIDPNQNTKGIKASLLREFVYIEKNILGVFIGNGTNKTYSLLTYPSGDIKENVGKNIFFDTETFDTWGKNIIAENRHFPVNGYSNAWYITPKDMNGKKDYTLIIEMSSQQVFYVSLAISIVFLLIIIFFLIRNLFYHI